MFLNEKTARLCQNKTTKPSHIDPTSLRPACCCSCLDLEKTSKCLTPSCPLSVWTLQTCWMTVGTIFQIFFFPQFPVVFCILLVHFVLLAALRQCSICQTVAEWECSQCYEDMDITPGHLKQYCQTCNTQVSIFLSLMCYIMLLPMRSYETSG